MPGTLTTDRTLTRPELSEGFEHLLYQLSTGQIQADANGFHCDVLIIGSGYGGAVAASELSRHGPGQASAARIWLLERGLPRPPGSFPDKLARLPTHVRFSTPNQSQPRGTRTGLFDVRIGPDMQALLGNGLGGGSLINAGVMIWPTDAVLRKEAWPQEIRQDDGLARMRDEMLVALGAQPAPVTQLDGQALAKHTALKGLAGDAPFQRMNVTVASTDGQTPQGVAVRRCQNCGDCATGCNHGAKMSLDTTLLAQAHQQGVQLFTGATALKLERAFDEQQQPAGWLVWCQHTDVTLRAHQDKPIGLRARHVVVSAGTLGSTELLLRSRQDHLPMSDLLGQRFSGNGDMLLSLYNSPTQVKGMAHEEAAPALRDVGPTITGMIDHRHIESPFIVQDLAIPGPLQAIFEEYNATSLALHQLNETDRSQHGQETQDPAAIDGTAMARTLPLAMIGHDSADGKLELISKDMDTGDGAIRIVWPQVKHDARFDRQLDVLQQGWGIQPAPDATRLFATPGWRPLPAAMASALQVPPGPMVTVHPLGGCVMGQDAWHGVVNHQGQVFDAQGGVYPDLVVLDGAIIPTSLGVNPALTIAVMAQRAARLLKREWGLNASRPLSSGLAVTTPIQLPDPTQAQPSQDTLVQITEQMRGWAGDHGIELTLRFEPLPALNLSGQDTRLRELRLDPSASYLKVIHRNASLPQHTWDEHPVVLQANLSGTLRPFHRAPSTPFARQWRGFLAYARNRGLRDTMQSKGAGKLEALKQGWALASHAGQTRLMAYDLTIESVTSNDVLPSQQIPHSIDWVGQKITGTKTITYSPKCNPWRQLMEMTIDQFPAGLAAKGTVLALNLDFLAKQSVPLLRITQQDNMAKAMTDLTRLGLQVARMLVDVHLWSMRKPDTPRPRVISRLPTALPGLPPPEIVEIDVAPPLPDGTPVRVRLTRFRQDPHHPRAQPKPVLMLHGYSASGTTYAHHALRPSLADYLWHRGYDVWVADLRTSCGMPTGTQPWSFEDVGYVDIPLAVQHVSQATGGGTIDVIAHCMGSAMLWTGLLGDPRPDYPPGSIGHQARLAMPQRIRRLAMSQVAPMVIFSPANVFRAYLSQYIQTLLPTGAYRFRADLHEGDDGAGQVLLDRLLATIPYPEEDFSIENPPLAFWRDTSWVGTRHRMDALYGRSFKLSNLSHVLRRYLDDQFGPLSMGTMRQGLHLARNQSISNAQGINVYLTQAKLRNVLDQLDKMMSFHGMDNGLSDISGMYAFKDLVDHLGQDYADKYAVHPIANHGHQDCLIGKQAQDAVFTLIDDFFREPKT